MEQSPKDIVRHWVDVFNAGDAETLSALYADEAINHQVAYEPIVGRAAIHDFFLMEFGRAKMVCEIENIFVDGEWAILEWSDPLGVRGCGFFRVVRGQIVFQRGYFDKLSFFKAYGIPLEEAQNDQPN